ncbi:hypothetical protein IAR55_005751 [Kwoniella newhampshirensis]|uniref:Uncharacterized protein n=1 Tax=Kwoniella newhampshirensis TaxID=1651941 RepID=A0AAW0YV32_9TREE
MSKQANTILLLHPPTLDPTSFISRLTNITPQEISESESTDWLIENKYYTAQVEIQTIPIGRTGLDTELLSTWSEVDVVLFVFEGKPPKTLPPTLIKLLADPRDIALAIQAVPSSSRSSIPKSGPALAIEEDDDDHDGQQEGSAGESEETLTELFEEIGMEFVDELNPMTEEDDERPLAPLEIIRQTLHTHMWPSMSRKPLHSSSQLPASPSSSSSSLRSALDSPPHASFPITFDAPLGQTAVPDETFLQQAGSPSMTKFPGLDELRAEIYKSQFEDIDRLDALIGDQDDDEAAGVGPGEEEYARLEDWLESDDEEFDPHSVPPETGQQEGGDWLEVDDRKFEPTPPEAYNARLARTGEFDEDQGSIDGEDEKQRLQLQQQPTLENQEKGNGEEGFEDDFTDFHSVLPPPRTQAQTHALDPTPLLLHLQSVRAELANVTDEDERRVRAGREVKLILESLGMGDLGDDLDGELEFEEGFGE